MHDRTSTALPTWQERTSRERTIRGACVLACACGEPGESEGIAGTGSSTMTDGPTTQPTDTDDRMNSPSRLA